MAEKSIDSRIQNFVGGILGGVASSTFSAPLDLARTRLQIQSFLKAKTRKYNGLCQSLKVIYKEEGARGLFKGYSATLVAMPSYHAMYFTSYHYVKDHLRTKFPAWSNSMINSFAAGITGVVCDVSTNPLWVVRQRMQTQFMHVGDTIQNASFTSTFRSIMNDEGPRALYRGLIASVIGVSHAMIFFPLYEYLKDHVILGKDGESKNQHVLASSIIAKTIASAITYPTAVVRTRQQENPRLFASYFHGNAHPTIRKIVSDTIKESGFKGFYAGFSADLARILPVTAIVFMTFEFTKKAFESVTKH